jgi:LmbE family N-acetylglucosaminyl deacetylase
MRLALPPHNLEVLCVSAHPDDVEIGCGGTLLQLSSRPATAMHGVVLTGSTERRDEARAAFEAFAPGAEQVHHDLPDGRLPAHWDEVKEALEHVATTCRPHLVLAPRPDDAHQDHRLLGKMVRTVWRDALVLHYEIPKWDGDTGAPSFFVPLTPEQARRKVELLNTHFPSQKARDWWDDELFLGLMRVRGMEAKAPYAEGFYSSKALLDLSAGGDRP